MRAAAGRVVASFLTPIMGTLDALAHLLATLAPAFGLALWMAVMVKLFWRRSVRGVAFGRLVGRIATAALTAHVAGWVLLGRDGRMGSYALMVVAAALATAWVAFGPGRARRGA